MLLKDFSARTSFLDGDEVIKVVVPVTRCCATGKQVSEEVPKFTENCTAGGAAKGKGEVEEVISAPGEAHKPDHHSPLVASGAAERELATLRKSAVG